MTRGRGRRRLERSHIPRARHAPANTYAVRGLDACLIDALLQYGPPSLFRGRAPVLPIEFRLAAGARFRKVSAPTSRQTDRSLPLIRAGTLDRGRRRRESSKQPRPLIDDFLDGHPPARVRSRPSTVRSTTRAPMLFQGPSRSEVQKRPRRSNATARVARAEPASRPQGKVEANIPGPGLSCWRCFMSVRPRHCWGGRRNGNQTSSRNLHLTGFLPDPC